MLIWVNVETEGTGLTARAQVGRAENEAGVVRLRLEAVTLLDEPHLDDTDLLREPLHSGSALDDIRRDRRSFLRFLPQSYWEELSNKARAKAGIENGSGLPLDQLPAETADEEPFEPTNDADARERINRTIVLRRGQREFRRQLFDTYRGKCAVTGCEIEDILEAAHICPFNGEHTNHVQNGLLLRADIHTLFDCGLLSIDPTSMRVVISRKLEGTSYDKLSGRKIRLPSNVAQWPHSDALRLHRQRAGL